MFALVVFVVVMACGQPAAVESPRSTPVQPTALVSSAAEVSQLSEVYMSARVLDVRRPEDFEAGHIPGATNISLGTLDPRDPPMAGWDRAVTVFVVDSRGENAPDGARLVAAAGFEALYVIGGMQAWVSAGLPTEIGL